MTHASLFTGFGGFDIASEWMGWDNVFHCENNPFCRTLLEYYFPNSESYGDITKTDFSKFRGCIDVLTGGFPCQPFSLAGERRGTEDPRHLWPQMLRAVREIKPRWIVGENVRGIVSWSEGLVFEQIHVDLENEGYKVLSFVVPAVGVNAPHKRDRVWFVAYAEGKSSVGLQEREGQKTPKHGESGENGVVTYATGHGHERWGFRQDRPEKRESEEERHKRERVWADAFGTSSEGPTPYSGSSRRKELDFPSFATGTRHSAWFHNAELRTFTGPGYDWENFPTQSPVCSRDDGFSSLLDSTSVYSGVGTRKNHPPYPRWRNESLKGFGNAVVPQVVIPFFQTIQDYENGKDLL